jgi:hypothetical protein
VVGCGSASSPSSSAPGASGTGQPAAVDPNAPEVSPPGDIPDNQAFVAYDQPAAGYSVKVPEGWARTTTAGAATTFTDKLNRIEMRTAPARVPLTVAAARRTELPRLAKRIAGFKAATVSSVTRTAGSAVRIAYQARSPVDAVTGTSHTDAVERYVFFHDGRDIVLTLSGPQGADNVDPWRIVTDSLRYTR